MARVRNITLIAVLAAVGAMLVAASVAPAAMRDPADRPQPLPDHGRRQDRPDPGLPGRADRPAAAQGHQAAEAQVRDLHHRRPLRRPGPLRQRRAPAGPRPRHRPDGPAAGGGSRASPAGRAAAGPADRSLALGRLRRRLRPRTRPSPAPLLEPLGHTPGGISRTVYTLRCPRRARRRRRRTGAEATATEMGGRWRTDGGGGGGGARGPAPAAVGGSGGIDVRRVAARMSAAMLQPVVETGGVDFDAR